MKMKLKNQEKGFTIIEVLIVLAIAGLIILVVFLAVPSLQRNSRNTQRKNDVSQVAGAVQEFINNNRGSYNNTTAAITATPPVITNTNRTQLTNINYRTIQTGAAVNTQNTTGTPFGPETMVIRNGVKCNPAFVDPASNVDTFVVTIGTAATDVYTAASATTRTGAIAYAIERQGGLTTVCQDI